MRKIQKRTAERLYNSGKTILLVPCKIDPNNTWGIGMRIWNEGVQTFERYVNVYAYYNCSYETGYRVAYYLEED